MAEKQKLAFFLNGKRFGYEGLPENRLRDLADFIVKRQVPETDWITVFRENTAGMTEAANMDDDQVMEMLHANVRAREAKKAQKAQAAVPEGGAAAPAPEVAPAVAVAPVQQDPPVAVAPPAPAPVYAPQPAPAVQPKPAVETAQLPAAPPRGPSFSDTERKALHDFIEVVLQQPPESEFGAGSGAQVFERPQPASTATTAAPVTPSVAAGPLAAAGSATYGAGGAKVTVLLETGPTDPVKMVNVGLGTCFDDFLAVVDKKFAGVKMDMQFSHEDDRIAVDDDDSLDMFLRLDVKKHKLFCTPAGRVRVEDALTTVGASHASGAALASALGAASAAPKEFHREQRTYTGHAAAVYCCAFSPSGDRFATASRDKSVRVWNVETGEYIEMQGGHSGFVLSCDFSPNGEHVVSSSDDNLLKLWSARTGEKKQTFRGHNDKVYCAKFNHTGAYIVSGSCDKTVRVWNVDNGSRQSTLKGHTMAVFSCGFSKTDNGKFVVSAADDKSVRIWDWRDSKEIRKLEDHTGTVWSCEFSHHDKFIVSASMDHEIKLWDVATGAPIRNFFGHMTPIHHAIFSPDDKYILSCARDWTVMVWEVESGKLVDTLSGHVNTVYHMDMLGDKLLTCSLDESVKLWTVKFA